MLQQTKSKLISLVIMAIAVLVVAFFMAKENLAISKEGKIVSRTATIDSDGDGLTDGEETKYKTNPNQLDSDGDGLSDLEEIQKGTDPNKAEVIPDADSDGLTLEEEQKYGTDPANPDTDGDGYPDGSEVVSGHDPLKPAQKKLAGEWEKNFEGLTQGMDAEALLKNIDTSPVKLPEIPDSELNLTNSSGKEAVRKYFDEVDRVLKKDLPFLVGKENIQNFASEFLLTLQNKEKIDEIKEKLEIVYKDIKDIPTPEECKKVKTKTLQILKISPQILNTLYQCQEKGDYINYLSQLYKIQSLSLSGEDLAREITNILK